MYIGWSLVLSNIVWILPAGLAYWYGAYWLVVPAILVMFLSMAFHTTGNIYVERVDTIFSVLYFLSGPVLIYQSGNYIAGGMIGLFLFVVTISIWFLAQRYDKLNKELFYRIFHSVWHLSTALLATVIYIVYLYPPQ